MTNDEFLQYSQNVDNIKILNFVGKKFHIDKDELSSLKLIALWKAALTFKGGKFTTHLYRSMFWECCKNRFKPLPQKKLSQKPSQFDSIDLKECISFLPLKQKIVINKRMENRTFEEIGKELNLSKERIRQIYKEAILKLRDFYKKD